MGSQQHSPNVKRSLRALDMPVMRARKAKCMTAAMSACSLAVALLLQGCGGGEGASVSRPVSIERDISPATIDSTVTTSTEPNVSINPDAGAVAANKLFVFLPGTSGVPSMYRQILRSGAQNGYHVIGINYPNPTPVGGLCNASADPDCFWNVRREIITGTDSSPLVVIGPSDSIIGRLTKALIYLRTNFPNEGWGQYLSGDTPDWSRITVSGHSQGGGHAGVLAKLFALDRVVYFASPADFSSHFNAPATWLTKPSATPVSRQYGFTHLRDPLVPYSELSAIWRNLGLSDLGSAISADNTAAPFSNSHMLTTNAAPKTGGVSVSPLHGATVLDAATPTGADGTPLFAPIWAFLCF